MKPSLPLQPFLVSKLWRHEAGSGLRRCPSGAWGLTPWAGSPSAPQARHVPHSLSLPWIPSLNEIVRHPARANNGFIGWPIIEWGLLDLGWEDL